MSRSMAGFRSTITPISEEIGVSYLFNFSVVDPYHFDMDPGRGKADPDPAFGKRSLWILFFLLGFPLVSINNIYHIQIYVLKKIIKFFFKKKKISLFLVFFHFTIRIRIRVHNTVKMQIISLPSSIPSLYRQKHMYYICIMYTCYFKSKKEVYNNIRHKHRLHTTYQDIKRKGWKRGEKLRHN